MPINVPLAKKSTLVTTPLPPATGTAVRVIGTPTLTVVPAVGALSDTVGTAALTVTLTPAEVVTPPFESVARAVMAKTPVAVGVQFTA